MKNTMSRAQREAINEILAIKLTYALEMIDTKDALLSEYDVIRIAQKTEQAMLEDGEVSSHLCDFDASIIAESIKRAIVKRDNGIIVEVPSITDLMERLFCGTHFSELVQQYNENAMFNADKGE